MSVRASYATDCNQAFDVFRRWAKGGVWNERKQKSLQRLSNSTIEKARRYMSWYFGLGPKPSDHLNDKILHELRRAFAGQCVRNPDIQSTPGQNETWFGSYHRDAKLIHSRRHNRG